jgi:hypothetical protein
MIHADLVNQSAAESEFRFDARDRDGQRSLEETAVEREAGAEHKLLDGHAVILRVEREVLVHESLLGEFKYVSGSFSDLNWAVLDGLTRAIGSLLPVVLSIGKQDVVFHSGFIVGNDRLCPAAQFSVVESLRSSLNHDRLIEAIQLCVDQLKDQHLWDHARPCAEGAVEDKRWMMVEAARTARQAIPGRQLPFSCSVSSGESQLSVEIGPALVRAKPRMLQATPDEAIGTLTGYCTHARVIKFKREKADAVVDIGFDEGIFLNQVFEFAGLNPPTVKAKWTNATVDGVISHRSLRELTLLGASLLTI